MFQILTLVILLYLPYRGNNMSVGYLRGLQSNFRGLRSYLEVPTILSCWRGGADRCKLRDVLAMRYTGPPRALEDARCSRSCLVPPFRWRVGVLSLFSIYSWLAIRW